jgi:hypothetical protein
MRLTPRLTQTQKADAELDVVDCGAIPELGRRAFNLEQWNQFQAAGEKRHRERSATSGGATEKDSPASSSTSRSKPQSSLLDDEPAASDPAVLQRKLYRWWLEATQAAIASAIRSIDDTDLFKLVRHLLWFLTYDVTTHQFTGCRQRR